MVTRSLRRNVLPSGLKSLPPSLSNSSETGSAQMLPVLLSDLLSTTALTELVMGLSSSHKSARTLRTVA